MRVVWSKLSPKTKFAVFVAVVLVTIFMLIGYSGGEGLIAAAGMGVLGAAMVAIFWAKAINRMSGDNGGGVDTDGDWGDDWRD